MRAIFLDDVRFPEEVTWVKYPKDIKWIVVVKNYNQFVNEIQTHGVPDVISWDNDLGIEDYIDPLCVDTEAIFKERNGYDAMTWLMNLCIERHYQFPLSYLHTMNPVAKIKMQKAIENFIKHFPHLSLKLSLKP
jgi:hypothetical protein